MALTDKLSNIAEAIRTKTETTGKMTLTEMPDKILGIQTSENLDAELTEQQQLISELKTTLEGKAAGGVTINNQDKTITENGTYTADEGYTGLGTVTVDVASSGENRLNALLQNKITEITEADFEGITSVSYGAFNNATSIKKVRIPKSLAAINTGLFTSVEVEDVYAHDLSTWMGIYFASASANPLCGSRSAAYRSASNLYLNNTLLTDLVIPNDITAIKNYSFTNCRSLLSITIPEWVTSVGSRAFAACVNVHTFNFNAVSLPDTSNSNAPFDGIGVNAEELVVNIGKMVEKIPAYFMFGESTTHYPPVRTINFEEGCVCSRIGKTAFSYCFDLETISIPQGVSTIYERVFYNCTSLRKIDFSNHTTVPTLSNANAFQNVPSTCKVIIPDTLYDEWINATNWSSLTVTYVKKSEYVEEGA